MKRKKVLESTEFSPQALLLKSVWININNLAKYKVKSKLKHARLSKLPFNSLKLLKQTKNKHARISKLPFNNQICFLNLRNLISQHSLSWISGYKVNIIGGIHPTDHLFSSTHSCYCGHLSPPIQGVVLHNGTPSKGTHVENIRSLLDYSSTRHGSSFWRHRY